MTTPNAERVYAELTLAARAVVRSSQRIPMDGDWEDNDGVGHAYAWIVGEDELKRLVELLDGCKALRHGD